MLPVPLDPRLNELFGLLELLGVEIVQGMVVIKVFRPRNELLEGDGSVGGQREILDVIDFTGPDRTRYNQYHEGDQHKASHERLRRRAKPVKTA